MITLRRVVQRCGESCHSYPSPCAALVLCARLYSTPHPPQSHPLYRSPPVSSHTSRALPPSSVVARNGAHATPHPVDQHENKSNGNSAAGQTMNMALFVRELSRVLTQPMKMGDLFRALSPPARSFVSASRRSLEELIMRSNSHFIVYRVGGTRSKKFPCMYAGPRHLVPQECQVMQLTPEMKKNGDVGSGRSASTAASTSDASSLSNTLSLDKIQESYDNSMLSTRQKIEEVLKYIPNEWSSFVDLQIPKDVKVRCMNYPHIATSSFLRKYPQYFDTKFNQGDNNNTFFVRRSEALQARINRYVATQSIK